MGGQPSKDQPTDEKFSNHSSINFVSEEEETSITAQSTSKKEEEMPPDAINLLESLCIGGKKSGCITAISGPPVFVEQSCVFQKRRRRLTSEETSQVPPHRRGGISSGSVRSENNKKKTEKIPKDQRSRDSLSRVFNTNIFFSHLDSAERSEICDALVQLTAQPGDVIIRQGDEGDTFYIIDLGEVEVVIDGAVVLRISQGRN